jgi:REP element-mobilizing transposase RayT
MARKPRVNLPGGFYHVILRGNGGQDIFLSDADRYRLYLLLQEGTCRFGYRVHAFCFMTNHLHLLLQAGDIPLSRGMQNLSFRYTRWVNRREKRTGHLFQGRFKALLIDGDSYLLELVRYIHLNPLRAGMTQSPEEHPWTSHHAYLGQYDLSWLTTGVVLGQFGVTAGKARDGYVRFILDGIGEEHRKDFHCGTDDPRILGSDAFAESALSDGEGRARRVSMEQVLEEVLGVYRIDREALRSASQQRRLAEARAMLAWLARESGAGNLEQVGRIVNRDAGSLSSAVRRLVARAGEDAAVAGRFAGAKSALNKLVDLEA